MLPTVLLNPSTACQTDGQRVPPNLNSLIYASARECVLIKLKRLLAYNGCVITAAN